MTAKDYFLSLYHNVYDMRENIYFWGKIFTVLFSFSSP